MGHFLVSAAHKSSGKTTVSLGLCAALNKRGHRVQAFKKGPDYIDPMWLASASGHPCHNLDFNTQEPGEILDTFTHYSAPADISLIEGNKGLYDGLDLEGSNSNAALAKLLKAPVILVIDARGMTRGIAPLILGYQAFDADINIAGVILNQLGGSRHEAKLRAVIEHYTDVPVIGAVHHSSELQILERHLGLIPSNEQQQAHERIDAVADSIARQVDLEKLETLCLDSNSREQTRTHGDNVLSLHPSPRCRIGVARDAAFGFYYPGDLEAFEKLGTQLVYFDCLNDQKLPPVDGLFIGGGFPETLMQALQDNHSLRQYIKQAIDSGLPVYAECGGLMYLSRKVHWDEQSCDMVAALPLETRMHKRPQGRGYVRLQQTENHPWLDPAAQSPALKHIAAHEFHYSAVENMGAELEFAYKVLRGTGIDGRHDGLIYKNVLANYSHFRDVNNNHWVADFVAFVLRHKHSSDQVRNDKP